MPTHNRDDPPLDNGTSGVSIFRDQPPLIGVRLLHVSLQGTEAWQGAATHVAAVRQYLRGNGATVEGVQPTRSARGLSRLGMMLWALIHAMRRAGDQELVYVRHHPAGWPLSLITRIRSIPRVEEVNGDMADFASVRTWMRPLLPVLRLLSRSQLRSAHGVIAVSEKMAEELRREADVTAVVSPNGADLSVFRPVMDDETPPVPEPYVLFVGALSPWQGVEDLLTALNDPSWPTSVTLTIIGDGVLGEIVRRRHDPPRLRYLGVRNPIEVATWTRHALATVSPKVPAATISSPLKVMESIASGVPVIASDLGQQAELLRRTGTGVLIPPEDPPRLAAAVERLHRDVRLRRRLVSGCVNNREAVGWAEAKRPLLRIISELTAGNQGRGSC